MSNTSQFVCKRLLLIGILSYSGQAAAWSFPWTHRHWVPVTPAAPVTPVGPTVPTGGSLCEGMAELSPAQAERQAGQAGQPGAITQNLTHKGMSLDGVPNAYQGRRLNFGSCSMAAALTQLNGYVQSHGLLLAEFSNPPFYHLGTLTPRRRALIFKTVGEADAAVEDNFVECHAGFSASAEGMGDCLSKKLGSYTCMNGSLQYSQCQVPVVSTFEGTLDERRAFIRAHFSQPDAARIVPLTCPWDTRVVLGPPPVSDDDVKFEHVSAVIGRRLTAQGSCEVLIRNSWGTCSTWKQQYAIGTCDNFGKTDDVWVEAESFLKRSGELTSMSDAK